jgi:hypothetical protein
VQIILSGGIYPGTLISLRRADGGIEYAASFIAGKRQLNMNIIAIGTWTAIQRRYVSQLPVVGGQNQWMFFPVRKIIENLQIIHDFERQFLPKP